MPRRYARPAQLLRHGEKGPAHDPDGEGQEEGDVRQDEPLPRVPDAEPELEHEDGHHQDDARHGEQDEHEVQEETGAAEAQEAQGIARHGGEERDGGDGHHGIDERVEDEPGELIAAIEDLLEVRERRMPGEDLLVEGVDLRVGLERGQYHPHEG